MLNWAGANEANLSVFGNRLFSLKGLQHRVVSILNLSFLLRNVLRLGGSFGARLTEAAPRRSPKGCFCIVFLAL